MLTAIFQPLGRLDEEPLGEAGDLFGAVAHAVAVGAVDQAGTDRGEAEVVGRRCGRASPAGRGSQTGVAELEAVRAGARQPFGLEVAGEVGVPVLVADRLQIFLEQAAARGGDVFLRGCAVREEQQGGQRDQTPVSSLQDAISRSRYVGGRASW